MVLVRKERHLRLFGCKGEVYFTVALFLISKDQE